MDSTIELVPGGMHASKSPAHIGHAVVAIVGAGPVGLITAIELARQGLQPVILDAKDGVAWSSRAICISRRSQEILDRIGAGPAFAAKALPWSRGRTFFRDRLVFKLDMPHGADDRHAPFVNLQQSYTEHFLLDTLAASGGAGVHWNSRVTDVSQDEDGVSLQVAGPEGAYTLSADWVVAADGGRSAVRERMGLPLHGTAYEGRYLIADIVVDGADWPVERHVWFDPPSNPGSTVILHVQPDGVWRVDYQLGDSEDSAEALADVNVTARLQAQLDMMGVRAPWRMIWKSVYKALALSLDSYRHGRVLFTGDAAHLVPIFGVRGLNSGIDDAHNLGWKLAAVVRGEAPPALLDSYSHERRRATRENHEQAVKSTWFMSPPGPGFLLMRNAVLSLAADHAWASGLINPRQSSAHSYDDSPVIRPDPVPVAAGVLPGEPLPNLPIQSGNGVVGHLQDALPAGGFALLVFAEALGGAASLLADPAIAAADFSAVLVGGIQPAAAGARWIGDPTGALARRFAADRFPVYLVRPDEHVAARFEGADPSSILEAFHLALGRMPAVQAASTAAPPDLDTATDTLGQAGLERVFEALSQAVAASGGDGGASMLARLSLLLAKEVGNADRVLALITAAQDTK